MKKSEKVKIVCPVCGTETMMHSSILAEGLNPFYCLKCNSLYCKMLKDIENIFHRTCDCVNVKIYVDGELKAEKSREETK
jgi:ribosomal protein S27AE